ncbi:MAG: hypothetical protein ACYSTL_02050 [Planctomycetota bacterium]|jgi:tetratricopeptide (TPR) repeat protein
MPETFEQNSQFSWVLKVARIALIASIVVIGLGLICTWSIKGLSATELIADAHRVESFIFPLLNVLGSLLAIVWLFVIYGLIRAIIANEAAVCDSSGRLSRIETLLEHQGESLGKLIELESISEEAKSLIYRETEIEALREMIHDDLIRQDFETAANMIETIRTKFGYADEAARLGEELQAAQKATMEERIDFAIQRIQQVIDIHDYAKALRGANKLLSMFPDNPKVVALPERIEAESTKHKRQLLSNYDEAVKKNDIDQSINLLKELDRYLSPQEAAALEESARGVFRAKLHNLGVRFAICVSDERWDEAVATGEEIIREFPNSRMSHEVRQKMPQLRNHAAEALGM